MDQHSVAVRIRSLYDDGGDPPFSRVRDLIQPHSDQQLAEVIEIDGRLRLALGRDLTLDRYLDADSLDAKPVSLDAAIEMALRAIARRSTPGQRDVESLIRSYPNLERPIQEAAMLAQALRSTTSIRRRIREQEPLRRLPWEIGPKLADGRRRYELIEMVGEGATGAVYRAIDRHLSDTAVQATVAIKVFSPPEDEAFAQWMREEAIKARRVTHENVVRALDRGETDEGESYIVYEFIGGGDLGDLIRRRGVPMPARDAARIIAAVARGVQAVHVAGLVHCDLKPGNIALTEDGRPKVADFGIAMREGQRPGVELAEPGSPLGNYAFISPEQFRGDPNAYSFPSDIYALGAMLAYLVSGQLPHGTTPEAIRARHEDPRPIDLGSAADRDLRRIVARATAVDPLERHSSARELADDLERWLERLPLSWGHTGPLRRTALLARRRPVLMALAAIALVAIAAAAGVKVREDMRRQAAIEYIVSVLQLYAAEDRGGENLALLSLWESFFQNSYIRGVPLSLHDHQIEIMRKLREEIRDEGETSESVLLDSTLALALVSREGDYLEGEPLAAECRQRWGAVFGAGDPMALRMAVVEAAAVVNRLLAAHARGEAVAPEAISAARTALEVAAGQLPARDHKGPVYKLYGTQLRKLNSLRIAVAAG